MVLFFLYGLSIVRGLGVVLGFFLNIYLYGRVYFVKIILIGEDILFFRYWIWLRGRGLV